MRWVTHQGAAGDRVGVLAADGAWLGPSGRSLIDLLAADAPLDEVGRDLERAGEFVPTTQLRLRCPVPTPPSFRDFLAFEEHFRNTGAGGSAAALAVWQRQPVFYFSNPAAFKAPGAPVPVPPGCQKFDFELEVAAVVGRAGSDLTPDEAQDCIAGLSILCDWSARDLQFEEMQVGLGPVKGKDSSTSMGPWLLSWDELADARVGKGFDLEMRAYVNDVLYSRGNLATIYWSFGELLAQASRGTTLRPGDVIGTGTVGRGCILELQRLEGESSSYPWLQPGDRVVLEVDRLGQLVHTITAGRPPARSTK
jgi:2-keto-4-pentenoate hydratase/2-oxohepta-3-ene-1,7-dioic acid hydratase in catechol pathway